MVAFLLAGGLALLGVFAGAYEAALRSLSRSRVRELLADDERGAETSRFLKSIVAGEASTQIAAALLHAITTTTFVLYAWLNWVQGSLTSSASDSPMGALLSWEIIFRLLIIFGIVACLRAGAAVVAVVDEEAFAIAAARPAWFLTLPLRPIATGFLFVGRVLARGFGRETEKTEEDLEEEVMAAVSDGELDGVVEKDQRKMIEGVFYLKEQDVADIFTPRTEMVSISSQATLAEAIAIALNKGHSRLPVHEDTRDDVVGIFYVRDVLEFWGLETAKMPALRTMMRKPLFVPETKDLPDLLHEMRRTKTHIAIVLDEYGGTAGLVTIEDVLEEIVGEIRDEFDDEDDDDEVHHLDGNTIIAEGQTHVADINKAIGRDIIPEDSDYETLAGFVLDELGHIPKNNEEFTYRSLQVCVLVADERRVEKVKVFRDRELEDD